MKPLYAFLTLLALTFSLQANAQEQEKPDPEQIAQDEIDRLADIYRLDDYQIFILDSILFHNIPAMFQELEQAQKLGAESWRSYQLIQDKWSARTDSAYQLLFTEEQWSRYMKREGKRLKKERDKRLEEFNSARKKRR